MPQDIAGCIVKRSKITPIAIATPPTEQTPSNVFQEVYNTPEIRQRIVGFLPPKTLRRIGTLEKRIYADVARELFHKVTFRQVQKMRRNTEWRAINCDAVRLVWFDATPLTTSLLRQSPELETLYRPDPSSRRSPAYIGRYDDRAVDLIIANIRKVCPLVDRIAYKNREAKKTKVNSKSPGDDWEIRLDRAGMKTVTIDRYVEPEDDDPESVFRPYACSKGQIESINITLDLSKLNESYYEAWRKFMRQSLPPNFDMDNIRLGRVSLSLPDILDIFNRDRHGAPWSRRPLEVLSAEAVDAYSIDELSALGHSLGSRMRHLALPVWGGCRNAKLNVTDLARLEEIIVDHFPCLEWLSIDLKYDRTSEIECLAQLKPAMATRRGNLRAIQIRVLDDAQPSRLFNLMRRLNPLLEPAGVLHICDGGESATSDALCRYMTSLPSKRRNAIATLDFSSIDLSHENQFGSIQWKNDVPQPFSMVQAAGWVDMIKEHRQRLEESMARDQAISEEMEEAAHELANSADRRSAKPCLSALLISRRQWR